MAEVPQVKTANQVEAGKRDGLTRRIRALFKRRQGLRVFAGMLIGGGGLILIASNMDTVLIVPGAAVLALGIVVLLGDGSGRSILMRRPGQRDAKSTPDALLWLWCFGGLVTALAVWEGLGMAATWVKADVSRQSSIVVTVNDDQTRVDGSTGPLNQDH